MTTDHTATGMSTEELLTRGVDNVIGKEDLVRRIENGEKLTIKLGFDPTSPNLHLGRAVALLKLRDFQQLGHKIVFIVGDFTGVIGDTSDKESERPMLTPEIIEENKQTYFEQAGLLIDLEKADLRHNTEWLSPLTYREIGEHADQFSVADFIARDNIKRRLDVGKRVSLREVLYPLMQGYDSVVVQADVEVGGTDQRFNMLAGRTLQAHYGHDPQAIITNPLIAGLDGRKMSSSWGNTINLCDKPADMYGKVMSAHDDLVETYFTLCTRVPLVDIESLIQEVAAGSVHPKEVKMRLAREIVTLYHGAVAAQEAEDVFVHVFQEHSIPEDIPKVSVADGTLLSDALMDAGIVTSKSDWRRLVEGGGVSVVDDKAINRVTDTHAVIAKNTIFKIGKRRFVAVQVN